MQLLPQFCVAWRWSVCGTAEVVWKPRFLWQWPSAHLHFFGLFPAGTRRLCNVRLTLDMTSDRRCILVENENRFDVNIWCISGAKSCWKMKSASLKAGQQKEAWSAPKFLGKRVAVTLVFKKTQWTNTSRWHCTPNHHRLWKLNTGLHATWTMSFSTLPPDSRTLVSKWNTKLALIWKEDFGPLGNSPVLILLIPGKTPLTLSVVQEWLNKRNTTTVAKFLDTSVCGGSWCLDPASVHSLWSSPKFLNRFCLTILIRLRLSRLVVHLFFHTFSFHSTSC